MGQKFWHRATRVDVLVSLALAFGGGTVVTWLWQWIVAQADPVASQGWPVVAMAVGLLGSLTLIALSMVALTILAFKGRRAVTKEEPARSENWNDELLAPERGRLSALEAEREASQATLSGLRKDVDRAIDAIRHNAEAMREENEARIGAMRKTVEHAIEQVRRNQEAMKAQFKAEADAAKSRTIGRFDALNDFVGAKIDELGVGYGRLVRALQARDATIKLRGIDQDATELFEKLYYAREDSYMKTDAWKEDYYLWRVRVKEFWSIMRNYSESVEDPFSLTDADLDGRNGIPATNLFLSTEMRNLYQVLMVVNAKHATFRDNAYVFLAERGQLPSPANPA